MQAMPPTELTLCVILCCILHTLVSPWWQCEWPVDSWHWLLAIWALPLLWKLPHMNFDPSVHSASTQLASIFHPSTKPYKYALKWCFKNFFVPWHLLCIITEPQNKKIINPPKPRHSNSSRPGRVSYCDDVLKAYNEREDSFKAW